MQTPIAPESPVARKARALYQRSYQGVLSTISIEMSGYPFGSVTAFCPDENGRPVMQLSTIAEHTRNLEADPRISLIVTEGGDDAQDAGRLTFVGTAKRLAGDEADALRQRFFRRFPHAEAYEKAHDFGYYRLDPQRLRYIGGFGRIHWLEPDTVCRPNPFAASSESGMVSHMNRDHADALQGYCLLFGIDLRGQTPRLCGIDPEGFDLALGKRLARVDFETPVTSADDVRRAMVTLALRARELQAAA